MANALETILTQPKKPIPEPPPTSKKDYGQVPKYLQKIKKDIDKEKKIVAEYVKQQVRTGVSTGGAALELQLPVASADSVSGLHPRIRDCFSVIADDCNPLTQEEAGQTHRIMPEDEKYVSPVLSRIQRRSCTTVTGSQTRPDHLWLTAFAALSGLPGRTSCTSSK